MISAQYISPPVFSIPSIMAQFSLNNVHKRGLKHHNFISFLFPASTSVAAATPGVYDTCRGSLAVAGPSLFK